jgi:choline dehydrogenase-like flavoprotein
MRKHQTLEPIDDAITERSTMPFIGDNHGTSGPVRTSFNEFRLPIEDDVIKACDEATGMTKKPMDPWSGDHIGFYNTLGTVARTGPNRGKRSYAARGYFETTSASRPNLKVLCEAYCTGLVIEDATAKGVNFTHNGSAHTVSVKHEVIVTGGTIMSPQILELSGIGDPEVLRAAGVELKVENKGVGNNFQDHVVVLTGHTLAPGHASLDSIYDPDVMASAQKTLMETGGGPLTGISSVQGFFPYKLFATEAELQATIKSINDTPTTSPFHKQQLEQVAAHVASSTSANLQFVLVAATPGYEHGVEDQSKLFPPVDPSKGMGITLAACLQYPASRGSIHISTSDPMVYPTIDPGYLTHPADVAVLAAGLKLCDAVAKSGALKDKLASRIFPAEGVDLEDTKQAEQAVRDWCLGEYHPAGSCAMGDVVDSRLKVKGVKGLRVADASVFPNHVSGNIVSSVYAVAEKASDMIKEDWGIGVKKSVK